MLEFIIKSSGCLLVFLLFYKLVLEKESMHHFKRIYLLTTLVFSLVIPLITFTTYVETAPADEALSEIIFVENASIQLFDLASILWLVYSIGVVIFGGKFMYNLIRIVHRIRSNEKSKQQHIIHVLLKEMIVPHTFFNYIFFNRRKYFSNQIPEAVIIHERVHAQQKHSLDVILIELIQVLFWFNPLIYLLKRDIKLNHEFLADQGVLEHDIDATSYQKTLLEFTSNPHQMELANAINYSLIKKRFTVMKTKTTKGSMMLKGILILPLLALTLYSFSSRAMVEVLPEDDITLLPDYNEEDTTQQKQNGASRDQMREYNELAKYYNSMPKDNMKIKLEDVERMKYIYSLMSEKQRQDAEPFPKIPKAPPAPDAAPAEQSDLPPPPPPDLPPPPPPLPDNASPEAQIKYEKAVKAYKEKALKAEKKAYKEHEKEKAKKAGKEKAKKAKKDKNNKQAQTQENYLREQAVLTEAQQTEKIRRLRERELALASQKAEIAELKELHASERETAIAELKEARMAQRAKIAEERHAVMAGRKALREEKVQTKRSRDNEARVAERTLIEKERRAQRELQRAELARVKEVQSKQSNKAHIKLMIEKDADFYYERKKISSKKALDLINENPNLNVQTRIDHNSSSPKVYLSIKPIKIKADD